MMAEVWSNSENSVAFFTTPLLALRVRSPPAKRGEN
jgi:hypothetical protein